MGSDAVGGGADPLSAQEQRRINGSARDFDTEFGPFRTIAYS
jgi:hypothetical protein